MLPLQGRDLGAGGAPAPGSRYAAATLERLLFRRQFILGPRAADGFPAWRRLPLGRDLHLTVHPDLSVTRVEGRGRCLLLLGYALDAARPTADDAEILTGLLNRFDRVDDVLRESATLGGRWVVIADDGTRTILFADAAGLRPLAYAPGDGAEGVWCASRHGLLAEILRMAPDDAAIAYLRAFEPGRHSTLAWFPGDTSPYAGIRVLLPNHYLDLGTGKPVRFWPDADLGVASRRTGISTSTEIVRGLVQAAAHRFVLMPGLTAGWDSRLVLAASRRIADHAFYHTALVGDTPRDHPDIAVPARLLARLGLTHHLLDARSPMDPGFAAVYHRSVSPAYEPVGFIAQALFDASPEAGVNVTGDAGEITRCDYETEALAGREFTARDLADVSRLPAHPFVLEAFERWLADARAHRRNVALRHLFAWEQVAGRTQAKLVSAYDVARESLTPFNCRRLLATQLGVAERFRSEPTYYLRRAVIRRLWPEVLVEPINGRPQVGAEVLLRRTLDVMGLTRAVPAPIKRLTKRLIRRAGAETSVDD
jgi:hypothetical protein